MMPAISIRLTACSIAMGVALAGAFEHRAWGDAPSSEFRVQHLGRQAPFVAVDVWAPPPGTGGGPFQTLVLLHGNQPDEPDRTWLIGLSRRPEFRRRVLVVPGLAKNDYAWDRPRTARAIVSLVDKVATRYPVDREAVFLVGYSAGGSRVLAVVNQGRKTFAGVASVAGDVGRPLRSNGVVLPRQPPSVLLVCMTQDRGPNSSCSLDASNMRLLRRLGIVDITSRKLDGNHALRFEMIAPVLDWWMARQRQR